MKKFFHDYSYSAVKMFVDQFAIAIFGSSLAFATTFSHGDSKEFDWFTLLLSICSVIFYLFLLYVMTWEIGAKDRISVDCGKKTYRPHLGLLLSLIANIPNLILACTYTVSVIFGLKELNGWMQFAATLLQGMYMGIIVVVPAPLGGVLNEWWVTYFLMAVPAMITCWIAYYLGFKNFRFFNTSKEKAPQEERPNMK